MKYASILFLLLLMSCQSQWDEKHLIGDWDTKSWQIENSSETINNQMDFSFKSDKTYSVDYRNNTTEKGKYWIETDYLVTVEEGFSAKKVRIVNLTLDTFKFRMNRAGRIENVLLTKR